MTSSKKKQWYESENGYCVEIISVLAFSVKNNKKTTSVLVTYKLQQ